MRRVIGIVFVLFALVLPQAIVAVIDASHTGDGQDMSIAMGMLGWSILFPAIGLSLMRKKPQKDNERNP